MPVGIDAHIFTQLLEASPADVRDIDAVRRARRGLVKVDGHAQFPPYPLSQPSREMGAVVHRCAGDRDERHDIGGSDARVNTMVAVQVDELDGTFDGRESRLSDRLTATRAASNEAISKRSAISGMLHCASTRATTISRSRVRSFSSARR